ncbi:MAG: hypothetical protein H7Y42_13995 [Chitinophagaceae bacterium]|nr:hypothetical protein [Chitinophagaceae bacterium]
MAKTGFTLALPLGINKEEALSTLQSIKDAAYDIVIQNHFVDCSSGSDTIVIMNRLYQEADAIIREMGTPPQASLGVRLENREFLIK